MAVFNGNDLVLAIGNSDSNEAKFAHAQSASISFSNSLVDVTTKDSSSWDQMISGRKSFTISADGLADFDDVASSTSTEGFSDLALAGTKVFFELQRPTGSLTTGDQLGWRGEAFIESFEVSGASDDAVTYSVSLKGTGQLIKVVV